MQCAPCIANCSAVVRLEREEDQQFVLQMSGLEKVGRRNKAAGRKTAGLAAQYFDTLHFQAVMGLVQKFALDFDLFKYDHWEYASRC